MSCKGLVELIVLNIGLQARILSTRTFTIFVVMALVTTFATTPLVSWLYPPWYQEKLELWKKGKINWDGTPISHAEQADDSDEPEIDVASRVLVYLRTDGLSSLFNILALLTGSRRPSTNTSKQIGGTEKRTSTIDEHTLQYQRPLRIHGLRLMELTERNSSVMKVSELEDYATRDPIIKAFGSSAYGTARDVTMSGQIAVVPDHSYANTLVQRATNTRSHLLLMPWSETGSLSEMPSTFDHAPIGANADLLANRDYGLLVARVFDEARQTCGVAVFVDKSLLRVGSSGDGSQPESPIMERATRQLSRTLTGISMPDVRESAGMYFKSTDSRGSSQIRVLYTGTTDDLCALRLALQLAKNGNAKVKVISTIEEARSHELKALRQGLSETLAACVHFENITDSSEHPTMLDGLLLNNVDESGDITILVGRNVSAQEPTSPAGSAVLEKPNVLGSVTTSLVARMKELKVAANLLVMQGKAPSRALEERRVKGMGISEESLSET